MTGRPALVEIPGDGEQVIEAARWAAARMAPDAGWWAGLAAVVLARRGRLDRARTWLESACSEQEGPARAVARWGEAEILRLEGRPRQAATALAAAVEASVPVAEGSTALWMLLESERLSLAEVRTASGPRRYVPTAPEHTFFEDRDYLSAIHLMRTTIRAVEAGQVPAQRLTEVLVAARSRRCVLEWCRAARLARIHGLARGRVPTGPDGADDVQRALLSLLAAGLSTRQCAVALSMQVRAVEYRIRALFEDSGTASRAQLVRAYVDGRVLDPSR
jgi:DNA-binding NarL/FixJ family response regulator